MSRTEPDEEFVREGAAKMTHADFARVIERSDDIRRKFEQKRRLTQFLGDAELLMALVGDYWHGRYREIPYGTIAAIVFALFYVLSPVDVVPDFLPVIGYIDDATVVAVCLTMIKRDLRAYEAWRREQAR